MKSREFIVDAPLDGQRLDKALAALLPELGLRARRRLWDGENKGQVLVNDRPRPPGYTVSVGDSVALRIEEGRLGAAADAGAPASPPALRFQDRSRFLEARNGLLFFHKPAGLHSAALPGGRGGASLEDGLASLVPAGLHTPALHLLNRLDCGTSGLMVAAGDADAAVRWHEAEDAGHCRKTYVTLLAGTLAAPITVTRALDTHHRRLTRVLRVKKTRVESTETEMQPWEVSPDQPYELEHELSHELAYSPTQNQAPDLTPDPAQDAPPVRHTIIEPLLALRAEDVAALLPPAAALVEADQPLTLALCRIRKGARHQIRAHAAYAGFPLWGDARYGGGGEASPEDGDGHFVLHHGMLEIPDGVIFDPCPWLAALPPKIANNITQSLKMNKFLS